MEKIITLEAYSLYKDGKGLVTVSSSGIKGIVPCKSLDIERLEQVATAYKEATKSDRDLLATGISSYLLGLKTVARASMLLREA